MSTTTQPVVTAAATPPAKVSLLKHIGNVLGKIAKVLVKDIAPAEPAMAKALEAFLPQFAPAIAVGDGLFTRITQQILVTEASAAAVASPPSGESQLQAVTSSVGSELDAWMKNMFPGAKTISAAKKSGLVQAIFDAVNEQAPSAAVPAS
jgi:hypothetical protein